MQKQGMFWIIDNDVLTAIYEDGEVGTMARNDSIYNQNLLWNRVRPEKNYGKYDHYPRGKVICGVKGRPMIILGPSVDLKYLPGIIEAFEITDEPHLKRSRTFESKEDRQKRMEDRRRQIRSSRNSGLL